MIKYRCTHDAGTDYQCNKEAYSKVEGRWLCKKHSHHPQPEIIIPNEPKKWPRANKKDPEEWKAYNRLYRQRYREKYPKETVYSWPVELVIWGSGQYYSIGKRSLWRSINKSPLFNEASYRCEICGSEVTVTRRKSNPPIGGWRSPFTGTCIYRNATYKISAPHECKPFPASKLKMVHCERCGVLGSNRTIHYKRYPRGKHYHNLCLSCWRVMRPLFVLEEQEYEFKDMLRELKYTMRKAGIHPNVKPLQEIELSNYTDNWYKKHPYL